MVLSIVFGVLCIVFFLFSFFWIFAPDFLPCWTTPIFLCLFFLFFFLTFVFAPPILCPECSIEINSDMNYCISCGYELIPHCIDCGEVCKTSFCKLCGAEQ